MPSKTWGTPQLIKEYLIVGENDEIPSGASAYIFNRSSADHDVLGVPTWEAFLQGDLTDLKNRIETDIPNTEVLWIKISWDRADRKHEYPEYWVYGFYVEALVKNKGGAALTGLEIALIIMAIAFLAAVIAAISLGSWITWEVMEATPDIAKPAVGIVLLIGIALFLLILFGAKLGIGKKGVTLGK